MVVDLLPICLSEGQRFLEALAPCIERTFQATVRMRNPWFDAEICYDSSRGQYHSTEILKLLLDDPRSDSGRIVGVAGVDLFVPVLTYVFGEAQLDGRAAVVSTHRLRPEMYGLAADDALLARRLETETIHELGHTYGLLHCADLECAMRASTYVEDIDLKTPYFCRACLAVVRAGGANRR